MKLQIKNLSKSFDQNKVLDQIHFTFQEGKIYALLGRNGAGKTTFFNCLSQDVTMEEGSCLLVEVKEQRPLEYEDIGYVLSTPVVPEFLTAREFLKFFLEINQDKIEKQKTIDEYFDFVRIDSADRDKLMKEYSHGMKTKMQMLINFIANPKVLLLDEPLTSLDVVVQEEMKQVLRQIKKDHILIFSTHILELAMDLCDEIVILNQGHLEAMEREQLNRNDFKEKILHTLKGEDL